MSNRIISGMIFLSCLITLLCSCTVPEKELTPEEYAVHISEWDSTRLVRLRAPDGWVNLAGLFWLREGDNSIGSAGSNNIVFPRGPEEVGYMRLEREQVWFSPAAALDIRTGGKRVYEEISIFGGDQGTVTLTVDSLAFFIIKRGERIGIRLRDYLHPGLDAMTHIDRYKPDQGWIIRARLIEPAEDIFIRVPDILGDVSVEKVPGILEFEYGGETWELYPTGSRDRLFVIFADDTNATETYGAGRFLSAGAADRHGFVDLDFNKAYNPPCAFSPYATCPLPPRENFLPFKITAGEKAPGLKFHGYPGF